MAIKTKNIFNNATTSAVIVIWSCHDNIIKFQLTTWVRTRVQKDQENPVNVLLKPVFIKSCFFIFNLLLEWKV